LAPQSIEEYLVEELVKDHSNIALIRSYLEKLDRDVIVNLFDKFLDKEPIKIYVSILKNRKLSSLESIVKYLRESGLTNSAIANLIGRSPQVCSKTYNNAQKKYPHKITSVPSIDFPVKILKSKFSVLESIVAFLKEQGLTYHEIAQALNRDDRTIWTVHKRALDKHV